MPLSARIPREVSSSVTPPLRPAAVPPTVRIASPSCATEVFDLLAAIAMLSANALRLSSVASIPRADMESVTMSEACASSIAPAPARCRTVGRAVAALLAS